jgi:hypothetical protein
VSLTGVLGGDTVTAAGTATFDTKDVGVGKTVNVTGITLSGADAGNYALSTTATSTTANITAVPLTVTANDKTRAYGVANPTFDVVYAGFVSGEDSSVLGGALSITTTALTTSHPGTYPITPSGLTSGNYTMSFMDGTLTVTQASPSLTLSSDPNPTTPGQGVSLTLSGPSDATGPVTFKEGATVVGIAGLSGGSVSIIISAPTPGSHTYSAEYGGNTDYLSGSASTQHTVQSSGGNSGGGAAGGGGGRVRVAPGGFGPTGGGGTVAPGGFGGSQPPSSPKITDQQKKLICSAKKGLPRNPTARDYSRAALGLLRSTHLRATTIRVALESPTFCK